MRNDKCKRMMLPIFGQKIKYVISSFPTDICDFVRGLWRFRLIFVRKRSKPSEISAKTLIAHVFAVRVTDSSSPVQLGCHHLMRVLNQKAEMRNDKCKRMMLPIFGQKIKYVIYSFRTVICDFVRGLWSFRLIFVQTKVQTERDKR